MIEFDPNKAKTNLAKHGIDFADAEPVLYDTNAFTSSKVVSVITVIWTMRGGNHRLISVRPARREEKQHYET